MKEHSNFTNTKKNLILKIFFFMKLEILSFDGKLFKSDAVVSVNTMTNAWEITVLNNHEPLITSLIPWVLKVVYITSDWIQEKKEFAIGRWILEVANNTSKILLDVLVSSEHLNIDEAEKAKKHALEMMEKYKNAKDKVDMEKFIEAEDQLLKSIAQLKLWNIK